MDIIDVGENAPPPMVNNQGRIFFWKMYEIHLHFCITWANYKFVVMNRKTYFAKMNGVTSREIGFLCLYNFSCSLIDKLKIKFRILFTTHTISIIKKSSSVAFFRKERKKQQFRKSLTVN